MSDPSQNHQPDPENRMVTLSRAQIQELERQAAEGKANANAARELAFVKAGIDTSSPLGTLVMKGYDGELTVEAIRDYAKGIPGAIPAAPTAGEQSPPSNETPPPPPAPPGTPEELAAQHQRELIATGAAPEGRPPEVDPKMEGRTLAVAAIEQHGVTEDEALGGFINHIANAAMKGDKRVLVKTPDRIVLEEG